MLPIYRERLRDFLLFLAINKGDVTKATWRKDQMIR